MEEEFENTYAANFDNIYRYLKFACGNAEIAKEIAHEVFLALWQAMTAKQSFDNVGGWLRAVAYNKMKEFYRRKETRNRLRLQLPSFSEDASQPVLNEETYQEVLAALMKLNQKEQLAIYYIDIQGIGYQAATDALGIPERTLRRLREKTWRKLESRFRKLSFPMEILLKTQSGTKEKVEAKE